jgi:acyl-coenzyme A synthetase/AMP-(fatty) acid ligase
LRCLGGGAPDRVAVTHLGADGTRSVWTYGDLKRASDRLAARWRPAA